MQYSRRLSPLLVMLILFACAGNIEDKAVMQNVEPETKAKAKPKLAVIISVDQMRPDHFTRFAGIYKHGFKRLYENGALFLNAHHQHANTVTGAGHATIGTGTYPSSHGIVGNAWLNRDTRARTYCGESKGAPTLDSTAAHKERGPQQLMRTGIGDWLKEQQPGAKVFSVARKDRASILTSGKKPDAAYWYNDVNGRIVTSAYYMKANPEWVEAFNNSRKVDSYFDIGWHRLFPEETYMMAREDDFPAEADGKATVFPHLFNADTSAPSPRYYAMLETTPFVDELVIDFAREMVINEGIGSDDVTDILLLGCSAADNIGHAFGPFSHESMDHFLRLDKYLGDFFNFLDDEVGKGNYYVVLSSDHGVLPLPEELERRGIDAGRIARGALMAASRNIFTKVGQELQIRDPLFLGLSGPGMVLNYGAAEASGVSRAKLENMLMAQFKEIEGVEDMFGASELLATDTPDRAFLTRYRNGYYPDRSGDIIFRFKENYLVKEGFGTTHGSPYDYDTQVPLLFMGEGVKAAIHQTKVETADAAPTLADLLGINKPDDLDGKSLIDDIR